MARTVPDAQRASEARFNQLEVQRSVSSVQQALGHSNSRNNRVVDTLCHFSLMASAQRQLVSSPVSVEKAARQLFRSTDGYQAAHYLPGQIKIANEFPWRLISDRPTSVRLECLFGEVENLPANFNKADSAAEQKGLLETFREASQTVLHDVMPKGAVRINRDLVRRVYEDVWVKGANNAFFAALAQKEMKPGIPDLEKDEEGNITNLAERSGSGSQWNYEDQKDILNRYIETMRTAPDELRDGKMAAIEQAFKP
jgi:hypothetical protein